MLIIRKEQMQVFRNVALDNFKRDMLRHFFLVDPFHCNAIGETNVRKVIDLGVDRASTYGINQEETTQFYLAIMFHCGSFFDVDPTLFWARDVLLLCDDGNQVDKCGLLRQRFLDYVNTIAGEDGRPIIAFLAKILRLTGGKDLILTSRQINDFLGDAYPEKYAYLTHHGVQGVIESAQQELSFSGVDAQIGLAPLSLLKCIYGHSVSRDRLFPWVEDLFTRNLEPQKKARMLQVACRAFLVQVKRYLLEHNSVAKSLLL